MNELPQSWYGTLTKDNAEKAVEVMEAVLRQRCSIVTIVASMEHATLRTGTTGKPRKNGRVTNLSYLTDGVPSIAWSIGDFSWSISGREDNPARISWSDGQLKIYQNAPAGHPLVWIFAPERED